VAIQDGPKGLLIVLLFKSTSDWTKLSVLKEYGFADRVLLEIKVCRYLTFWHYMSRHLYLNYRPENCKLTFYNKNYRWAVVEDSILRSMKRYIPELVDIAMTQRPNADRGSVEVGAAVSMLIATIHFLNMLPRTIQLEATIDSLVDRLPKEMEERSVSLKDACPESEICKRASLQVNGATRTNLNGAFSVLYNLRVAHDLQKMSSLTNGPFGELGGVCATVGSALVGDNEVPPMLGLLEVFSKHLSNVADASASKKSTTAGSKSCFIATACFDSPENETVMILRRYREAVLKKSTFGRWIVKTYYKASPPLADLIRNRPKLKKTIGVVIRLIATALKSKLG
jgi:hypothetical protein